MAKSVILANYLPQTLREVREFREINRAETAEVERLLEAVDNALDNMFIETANADGVARFEKLLGIYPDDGDDLDTRRFRVQTMWNDQLPYTESELRGRLTTLCGKDGYILDISYPDYTMVVKVAVYTKSALPLVEKLLENIVPCNMAVTVELLYNAYGWLSEYTHDELSGMTHSDVRNSRLK